MIRVLEIIASSWPIAVIIISAMIGSVALYIINWFKKSDSENKALRASQAVMIRNREND